jgi:Glucokinase
MFLVGDIGGTKSDLAIYSNESGLGSPIARRQFHSSDYASLQAIVKEFLAEVNISVRHATFDVAGPVIGKSVVVTNLPWIMNEDLLAADLNLKSVHLMNDLEAVARSIPILGKDDIVTLNAGEPVPESAIGVIAPGTGLGESFLIWVYLDLRERSRKSGFEGSCYWRDVPGRGHRCAHPEYLARARVYASVHKQRSLFGINEAHSSSRHYYKCRVDWSCSLRV